jgi:hypothetical protein
LPSDNVEGCGVKVLIATPAYGAVVTAAYHESVLNTVRYFQEEFPGIRFESMLLSLSMITTSRNLYASTVLNDPSYTHLLFIDSDMGFSPSLVARMLALQKPIVGIVAPLRKLDLEAYHKARLSTDSPLLARILANEYVAGDGVLPETMPDGSKQVTIVDGFVRATHTGTGIMLIDRTVFEALRDKYPDLWMVNPPAHLQQMGKFKGGYLQCFDVARGSNGMALGEDVSFCLRWSQGLGGEIWVNVDEPILHIGQETFSGRYLTKLERSGVTLNIVNTTPTDA